MNRRLKKLQPPPVPRNGYDEYDWPYYNYYHPWFWWYHHDYDHYYDHDYDYDCYDYDYDYDYYYRNVNKGVKIDHKGDGNIRNLKNKPSYPVTSHPIKPFIPRKNRMTPRRAFI